MTCYNLLPIKHGKILRVTSTTTPETIQQPCDGITSYTQRASLVSALGFPHSRSFELQWQPRSYNSSILGTEMKHSEESKQSRAELQGSANDQWLNLSKHFRRIRKQDLKYERKAHRHLQCWSRRLTRARCPSKHRLWFCELPDTASSEPYASTSDSDSDDFDYRAFIDRPDQRDQLSQTGSPNAHLQPFCGVCILSRQKHVEAIRRDAQ